MDFIKNSPFISIFCYILFTITLGDAGDDDNVISFSPLFILLLCVVSNKFDIIGGGFGGDGRWELVIGEISRLLLSSILLLFTSTVKVGCFASIGSLFRDRLLFRFRLGGSGGDLPGGCGGGKLGGGGGGA